MSLARVELKKAVVTIEEDGGLLFVNKQGEEEGTLRLASVDPPDTWRHRGYLAYQRRIGAMRRRFLAERADLLPPARLVPRRPDD